MKIVKIKNLLFVIGGFDELAVNMMGDTSFVTRPNGEVS